MKYFQSFCKSIGDYGCYLLCLIDVAEEYLGKELDKIDVIEKSIDRGYVTFNRDNYADSDNFYVKEPCEIMKMITGKNWEVRKEDWFYTPSKGEYVIEFWSINTYQGHFARMHKNFNSLQKSNNVEKGKINSYRVLKIL